jgi:hypothetical protein
MTRDFAALKVPGPTKTRLTRPFWEAAAQGRLLIQRCNACGEANFYPREVCPHCWSLSLLWEEARGVGHLKTFSVIYRPGHPAWVEIAPYAVGLVALVEGPTLLSHILGDPEHLAIGMPLKLQPTRVGDETLPFFTTIKLEDAS